MKFSVFAAAIARGRIAFDEIETAATAGKMFYLISLAESVTYGKNKNCDRWNWKFYGIENYRHKKPEEAIGSMHWDV